MDTLKAFNYFHDWYVDTFNVSKERETLTLGLYLEDRRASVSFVGMNRCVLTKSRSSKHRNGIEILEPGTQRYSFFQRAVQNLLSSSTYLKCGRKARRNVAQPEIAPGSLVPIEAAEQ